MSYRLSDMPDRIPAPAPAHRLTHLLRGSRPTDASGELATSSCRSRSVGFVIQAIMLVAIIILIGWLMTQPAGAATPKETSIEYRDWALDWRQQCERVRARALKHTRALGIRPPAAVPKMQRFIDPATGEEFVDWQDYGAALKAQTKNWREYLIPKWHRRLTHPGGSGAARWWPLARFVGWPTSQKANVIYCIWAESRGNPADGPCLGLMQIHPVHARAYLRVTGHSVWEYRNSKANLQFGLWLWQRSGWGPWVTM